MENPSCSKDKESIEGPKDTSPSIINPSLANYLKAIDEEKQEWKSFVKNLQKQYYKLKSDVANGTKFSLENFNYLEHLTKEELEFCSQVRQARDDHISSIENAKKVTYLAKQQLKNHETFICHLLSRQLTYNQHTINENGSK